MRGTFTTRDGAPDHAARRITWRARASVLGGLAFAALYTTAALALGAGAKHIGLLWMAAIGWTFAASLASALWRGVPSPRLVGLLPLRTAAGTTGESHEFTFKTGRHSSLRAMEDELLHDDDHLR